MKTSGTIDKTITSDLITRGGINILRLSHQQPVMLVFLRHFGCTFCREAMRDLGRIR